jgi:hypothetical protein
MTGTLWVGATLYRKGRVARAIDPKAGGDVVEVVDVVEAAAHIFSIPDARNAISKARQIAELLSSSYFSDDKKDGP